MCSPSRFSVWMTILSVLEVLKKYFERDEDFSVFTCTNGSDALHLISQYQFDAIIADYSMPEMDGITLLKEIRSQNDPVLFILFTGGTSRRSPSRP